MNVCKVAEQLERMLIAKILLTILILHILIKRPVAGIVIRTLLFLKKSSAIGMKS